MHTRSDMRRWFFTTCAHAARVRRFWALGDKERALGVPISPLCDREKDAGIGLVKNQIGFFNFVCLPYYTALARALPASRPVVLANCQANFEAWNEQLSLWKAHAPQ